MQVSQFVQYAFAHCLALQRRVRIYAVLRLIYFSSHDSGVVVIRYYTVLSTIQEEKELLYELLLTVE